MQGYNVLCRVFVEFVLWPDWQQGSLGGFSVWVCLQCQGDSWCISLTIIFLYIFYLILGLIGHWGITNPLSLPAQPCSFIYLWVSVTALNPGNIEVITTFLPWTLPQLRKPVHTSCLTFSLTSGYLIVSIFPATPSSPQHLINQCFLTFWQATCLKFQLDVGTQVKSYIWNFYFIIFLQWTRY